MAYEYAYGDGSQAFTEAKFRNYTVKIYEEDGDANHIRGITRDAVKKWESEHPDIQKKKKFGCAYDTKSKNHDNLFEYRVICIFD
ncbi:hypothetical protein OESDEN_07713 [Oesophagostomum dentatum]|uniref:SCP domain-containing protein n=1 Tax=Oesophagostomum dentatum TaxID=61180 RepID=A0A0B1TAJ5_OESDE|nr:hypothetical protein OESDEN_07713 [Oesophagostomum dentatum]